MHGTLSWTAAVAVAALACALSALYWQDPAVIQTYTTNLLARFAGEDATSAPSVDCSEALLHLTTENTVKGFHVLCIETTPADTLFITGYKDGMTENRTTEVVQDINAFKQTVEELFEITQPEDEYADKYKQPYAFFTPDGARLGTRLGALVNRVVFLFEGGPFVWPGITIGHKRVIKNIYGRGDV
ncbi:hypothetical protein Poli38472_010678 [Pythium oligandrum]|uniref:Uncharacterized protein n=1 Tax=Pythium oligandrum TaxID=41045 RepID=A0A8K1CEA8_PYTOL|nr:hypothetical protein Poli38472_010678 [Pythium oligandrum]|eukprot:TMW61615.1 hypothetical protein Poli38472_010678 [Pythium oligandrum]